MSPKQFWFQLLFFLASTGLAALIPVAEIELFSPCWCCSRLQQYNGLVTRPGHVIPTMCQWSCDYNIDLDLSFTSNRTSDIFYLKILHALLSASDLPCIDLDITSQISTLAFFWEEVLHVLRNQGQAACLIAGLQKKTSYRLAPFWIWWWWSEGGSLRSIESHLRSHE